MSVITSVSGGLFTTLITLVACIYILLSKKQLERQASGLLYAYVKKDMADKVSHFFKMLSRTFKKFLSSQCIDALILGILLLIALKIFRIPYAEIISVMTVILALIPYFGAFISCGVGAVLIALDNPKTALIFVVIFLVIQQIEGNLIYPRIVGTSVGLPPLWTLLAVYVGGELFGIVGMILFIPVVSVAYTLISENVAERLKEKKKEAEKIESE
jgi:predicted PurR-regulated permease PerM